MKDRFLMFAVAAALAGGVSVPYDAPPRPERQRKRKPTVIRANPAQTDEIAAWNAAVDAKQAAKRARKEAAL